MPISFEILKIGEAYERRYLAEIWGYKGFQAISRGVVTPAKSHYIVLFVTKEKQGSLTQYKDFLNEGLLHWEGESGHASDNRILNSSLLHDKIHLFYRDKHHSPFTYYGEIYLVKSILRTSLPSQFLFKVPGNSFDENLLEEIEVHEDEYRLLEKTEKNAIVKSRIGQGLFREGVVKLWGQCAVTGLKNLSLLRASHIKPWKYASNNERLDPMNGLLLQPSLDHVFDLGLVTFDSEGWLIASPLLSYDDLQKLGIVDKLRLNKRPTKLMKYMVYHRRYVFKDIVL